MRILSIFTASLLAHSTFAAEEKVPLDPVTGMKIAPDWELVRNHCIICHSPQTFLRQRATEANWVSVLEWMQTNGGLWKLEPEVQKAIIKYLATHYGPGDSQTYRRAPIPATQMPPNPYSTDARIEAEARKREGLIPKVPPVTK